VLELLDLIVAERIVVLHSPSGAGKSSLVQAALIPRLAQEGFQVPPPIRVNREPTGPARDGVNR
jgi:guanylate kinase